MVHSGSGQHCSHPEMPLVSWGPGENLVAPQVRFFSHSWTFDSSFRLEASQAKIPSQLTDLKAIMRKGSLSI